MASKKSIGRQLIAVALVVVLYLGNQYLDNQKSTPSHPSSGTPPVTVDTGASTSGGTLSADDTEIIQQAFNARRSDVWVQARGEVQRTLPDDNDGSRHQRFLVRLNNDLTILIAHNIDLAPRIPLQRGDLVEFRGEYEWNDKGGVVHWTHHDPGGRRQGGWITHERKKYD